MNIYLDSNNFYVPTTCLEIPSKMVDVADVPAGNVAWMRSFQYEDGKLVFRPRRYKELGGETT